MTKKSGLVVLVSAVLIGFLVFLIRFRNEGKPAPTETTTTKKLEHLKVAQFADFFLYMPLYLAQGRGFFESNGLVVDIVSTGGDDKTFAAVISGDVQFGIADPTFVAIARSKGQTGKVIGGIVNGVPFWGVTKNTKVPEIKNPKQLDGFSVATFPSPSTAFVLQEGMFKNAGLVPNIRQGAFGALLPMLDNNQADIALELEPNVSTAVKDGARIVYSMSDIYGDFAITGVTTSEQMIETKPDTVARFVKSIAQAEEFAHNHPEETLAFAVRRFPSIDPAIVKAALSRVLKSKTLPKTPVISNEAWRKACQVRVDAGEMPSLRDIDKALDNSFAERASR